MVRTLSFSALAIAAVITIMSMLKAANGEIDLGTLGFMLWVISPYTLFAGLVLVGGRLKNLKHLQAVMLIITLGMLGFTMLYLTLDGSSSTEALVFVFVPLYLSVGGLIAFGLGLLTSWIVTKRN